MAETKRFAADTTVQASRTKQELDELLARHGATQRGLFEEAGRGVCIFTMAGRQIRLQIKLPTINTDPKQPPRGWYGWSGKQRSEWAAKQAEQEGRATWRRLLLVTKAKLELVHDGNSIEREFLADVVLPDGRTVHEALGPQLDESYRNGEVPKLLGPGGGA